MPLDTNTAFKQEARKRETKPIFLYTIYDYDGGNTDLYYSGHDKNVIFDSIEYIKFPVTHDVITENVRGEIDSTKIQLSNVARLIEFYLQNYDLRGMRISIKMVYENHLDDPDAYIEFSNYVDSYTSNVKDVVFNIMSRFDILGVIVPGRIYIKSHCQWVFKSDECGYDAGETECNKTRTRCRELANRLRWGAFPSAPGGSSYA